MRLFLRRGQRSRNAAKNRLLSVLNGDRSDVSCEKILEKMRKDVLLVLKKYTADNAPLPVVCTSLNGAACHIAVDLKLENDNIR